LRLQLDNYDDIYADVVSPLLINNIKFVTQQDKEKLSSIIMTTYDKTDLMSSVPSCLCGELTRGINMGKTCPYCLTEVVIQNEAALDLRVWIQCPDKVLGFINP